MKNCPHCKARIEDEARFCMYCMTSLDVKEAVAPPLKRNRFLPIAAAAMILAVTLTVVLLRCQKDGDQQNPTGQATPDLPTGQSQLQTSATTGATQPPETVDTTQEPSTAPTLPAGTQPTDPQATTADQPDQPQSTQPQNTQPQAPQPQATQPPTAGNRPQNTPTQSTPTNPTQPKPTVAVCSHQYQLTGSQSATCTAEGSNTYTCSLCAHSYRDTVPATGHSYRAATCLQPQVCKDCSATGAAALGHSYRNGICIRCGDADAQDPRMVYEYREAGAGDQLADGTWDPKTDIVITGIKQIAGDGVYEIPAYIDGKRVIAIRPLAFSGTDAKQVTLGENIVYVAPNAFSGCYDIEALYVRPDFLFLSRSAFIPASSRSCKLRIYCSAQCTVDDDLKGECCLKDIVRVYGGEYYEWNG